MVSSIVLYEAIDSLIRDVGRSPEVVRRVLAMQKLRMRSSPRVGRRGFAARALSRRVICR